MKKKYIILPAFLLLSFMTQAQLNQSIEQSAENKKQLPERVLVQFTNGLDPASFVASFSNGKNAFITRISKIITAQDFAKNVSILAGYIKPDMFKDDFSVSHFKTQSLKVKTSHEAGDLIKNLEKNLRPIAFSGVWKLQKNGWVSNVNNLN